MHPPIICIIVLQEGDKFCEGVTEDGITWPKTPAGDTVIIRTCPTGRVGYKSRTCDGTTWQLVFSACVKEELKKIFNEADVSENFGSILSIIFPYHYLVICVVVFICY